MTFNKAFIIASKNPTFCVHLNKVTKAYERFKANPSVRGEKVDRLIFIVDGEYFYYGFNGIEIEQGKLKWFVAEWMAERGKGLLIRDPY